MNRPGPLQSRRALLATSLAAAASLTRQLAAADQPMPKIRWDERLRAMASRAPLAMRFQGSTAQDCRAWQARFATLLKQRLGSYRPPQRWETMLERRVATDEIVREERLLLADGLDPLPVHLLLPRDRTSQPSERSTSPTRVRQRPAIVAIHGHGPLGYDAVVGKSSTPEDQREITAVHYDYGLELARRGYIVAAPCLTPFGRRAPAPPAKGKRAVDACGQAFTSLQLLGKLLIAENLRDVLWTLEYLSTLPQVDSRRIGCVGLSYGGRMAMLATALEPRIRVAAISGALNVFQERVATGHSAGCQVIPGLLEFGDVPEIGSLIAPRPAVWEVGAHDDLIDPGWAEQALSRMRRAYHALGADDELQVDRFGGRHEWHGTLAYQRLSEVLKPSG